MPTLDQIRAARALLNWSQSDLAERAGLSQTGIARIESGVNQPNVQTMEKIAQTFDNAGIEFLRNGVIKSDDNIRTIVGEDCYIELLLDVSRTLRDHPEKELLIWFANDRMSPPPVNDLYRQIRASGIKMRQIIEEGNHYRLGGNNEYREFPSRYFINVVKLSYGNKYAILNGKETRVTIQKDEIAAASQKALFNFLWDILPEPKGASTADEHF